jgi:hypothetical protein
MATGSVVPSATLSCQAQINAATAPPSSRTTTLGDVALQTREALGVVFLPNEADPNARFWAKTGLNIKVGASFALVVPPEWRGRLSLGWGLPAQRTTDLKIAGCQWMATQNQTSPRLPWLGFAGGFWVSRPACVSVLVTTRHTTRRLHIGVGAPCPGQRPPHVYYPSPASK